MAEDFFGMPIVYRVPGMDEVTVRKDITYKRVDGEALLLDTYRPSRSAPGQRHPAVIFVHGDGPPDILRNAKGWGQYASWGRLAAASGLAGITFNHRSTEGRTRLAEAAADVDDLVSFVRARAGDLAVDPDRLCLWTCSMGPPVALRTILRDRPASVRCIVCLYGAMDLGPLRDETPPGVSDAVLREFSPLNLLVESTVPPPPLLLARAGLEERPWLNPTIDRFAAEAAARGAELDLLIHPRGRHAFDVLDDDGRSRDIIARTVQFMARHAVT